MRASSHLLYFVAIAVAAVVYNLETVLVEAVAVPCTADCANTLYTNHASVPLCEQKEIILTCTSGQTVYGGDVFSVQGTDITTAATWSGFCTNGQSAVTLYLYWAGFRTAFYQARRVSGGELSFGRHADAAGEGWYGVLLTDLSVCPTWLSKDINVIQKGVQANLNDVTTKVVGSCYYAYGTQVQAAVAHRALSAGDGLMTPGAVYMHSVGKRKFYLRSRGKACAWEKVSLTLQQATETFKEGFLLSNKTTLPNDINVADLLVQPVWVDWSPNRPPWSSTVYGVSHYQYQIATADAIALHSGLTKYGQRGKWIYMQFLFEANYFYASTREGIESSSLDVRSSSPQHRYAVTPSLHPDHLPLPPNPAVTQRITSIGYYPKGSAYGHTVYAAVSDLNVLAIFEGLSGESDAWTDVNTTEEDLDAGEVLYVHQVGMRPFFPRRDFYNLKSYLKI